MNRTQAVSLAEKIADFAMLCTEGDDRDALRALHLAPMFFELGRDGEQSGPAIVAESIMSEVQMYANLDYQAAAALRKAIADLLSGQPRPITLRPADVVSLARDQANSYKAERQHG